MINSSYHCVYLCMSNSLIKLNGINSISMNKSVSFENGLLLGGKHNPMLVNQPSQISVTIEKSFVEHDTIQSLTGTNKVDYLFYSNGGRFFRLHDLYLNGMQASFEVGDLPKINFTLSSYNGFFYEIDSLNTGSAISFQKSIPKLNSIYITSQNPGIQNIIKDNNYIYSMDYSVNINRKPQYSIGSIEEAEVSLILPIQVSSSITAKEKNNSTVSQMQISNFQSFYYDFNINVSGSLNSITSFPMRMGKFVSREIKSNSDYFPDVRYIFNGSLGGNL